MRFRMMLQYGIEGKCLNYPHIFLGSKPALSYTHKHYVLFTISRKFNNNQVNRA